MITKIWGHLINTYKYPIGFRKNALPVNLNLKLAATERLPELLLV